MYRTKIYDKLEKQFLLPIIDFVGLGIDNSTECGLLKWIGCCKRDKETGKVIPKFFTNPYNEDKIYAIARNQNEFINFKSRKDELEFFNPFIKYKNALLLLLYTQPIVYERYCISEPDEDNLAELIVNDEIDYSPQELYKYVSIKQFPVTKDEFDNAYYKFSVDMTVKVSGSKSNESDVGYMNEVSASSKIKIAAVIMTIIKVMGVLEEAPEILDDFNGNYEDLQIYLEDLLEKYVKERELNRKDLKKVKIDNEVETFTADDLDLFENSVEDLLNSSDESDEKENDSEPEKVINVSDKYKKVIPIESLFNNDDDNKFMDLDFS